MKKTFVLLTLIAATATFAFAQDNALPGKYAGSNTITLFDSTGVYMEESGLSHVMTHKCIEMNSFKGCSDYSTYKIDYDPLSAYCDIERVLVHRHETGKTDTLLWPGRDGNIKVYDYVAPARMIYWGASQKMVQIGRLNLGDKLEVWTYKKGYTYALLQDEHPSLNSTFAALPDDDARYVPPMKGHYYDIVPFWSDQPIQHKVYQLNNTGLQLGRVINEVVVDDYSVLTAREGVAELTNYGSRVSLTIVIRLDAAQYEPGKGYSVDGQRIAVGTTLQLNFPGFSAEGVVVNLNRVS